MQGAEQRRFLAMALRRAKPGSGSLYAAVREARAPYDWSAILPALGDMKYAIVGGLATARYMPARMTLDTDILVSTDDLGTVEALLADAGCRRVGSLTIGGSSWRMPGGRSLDVIATDAEWVGEALATAVPDDDGRPFIGLPFLVLMKLISGRLQDLADISRMLGCASASSVGAVRAVIARYRPQDLEDLESMRHLGRIEWQR